MNLREALIQQAPSLALQRAAADEIARLDSMVKHRFTINDVADACCACEIPDSKYESLTIALLKIVRDRNG